MNNTKDLLVLKLGTSTLFRDEGALNLSVLASLAEQIAKLHGMYRVAIVSSGAVAAGRDGIAAYAGHDAERKAAAAMGNHRLIQLYSEQFAQANISVAQILCDRAVFAKQQRFLGLQETLTTLWHNNVIPIINENDAVSSEELRFSDNDELAALIAIGLGAQQLLIGTSVAGLLDAGTLVKQIDTFTDKTFGLVHDHPSSLGRGGMASKLRWARRASASGTETVIFDARVAGNVLLANQYQTGTVCAAQKASGPH